MFPALIPELPPHREVEFSIQLIQQVAPTCKETYKVSTLELVDLRLQLKEMLDKGYIRPSVTLGCTNIICKEEGRYSQIMH